MHTPSHIHLTDRTSIATGGRAVSAAVTTTDILPGAVIDLLPPDVALIVRNLTPAQQSRLEEIRMRLHRPLELVGVAIARGMIISPEHLRHVMATVTGSSVYAVEQELRRGYVTLAGGHRVGVAGRVVVDEQDHVRSIRDVGSVNIRLARQIIGSAERLGAYILEGRHRLLPTLIAGPPLSGKTTLLRDLARLLGNGELSSHLGPLRVAIVDERSEIAGCYKGAPQFDVGLLTDVLDGCPKQAGMYLMLRSMAPQVLMTDEIGSAADVQAIVDVALAGVCFVGTLHARTVSDLQSREAVRDLLRAGAIERILFVGRKHGPGTIERVYDGQLREVTAAWH